MTYRVDKQLLDYAADGVSTWRKAEEEYRNALYFRDRDLRAAYVEGRATLQQLADATGLTRQRIQQICSERPGGEQ
jgi:DNA-directed RNA polymerase sigma subunit (sigma70/sigma32)